MTFFARRDDEGRIRIPSLRGRRRHRRGGPKPPDGTIEELFDCSRPIPQHRMGSVRLPPYHEGDDLGGCGCGDGCGGCDGGGCGSCEGSCGGSWGDSGSYSGGNFNADAFGGDPSAGAAWDVQAPTGGGDWGSFGATNYSGFNVQDPNNIDPSFGMNAYTGQGLAGVSTGGGDWGSAGTYSAGQGGTGQGAGYNVGGGGVFGGSRSDSGGFYGWGQPSDTATSDYGGGGGGGRGGGGGGFSGGGGGRGGGEAAPLGGAAPPSSDDDAPTGSPAGLPSQAGPDSDSDPDSSEGPAGGEPSGGPSDIGGGAGQGPEGGPSASQSTHSAAGDRGGDDGPAGGEPSGGPSDIGGGRGQGPEGGPEAPSAFGPGNVPGAPESYDQTNEGPGGPAYSQSFAPAYSPDFNAVFGSFNTPSIDTTMESPAGVVTSPDNAYTLGADPSLSGNYATAGPDFGQTFSDVQAPSGMDLAGDQGLAALGWGISPALAQALDTLSQTTQQALTPGEALPTVEVTAPAQPTYSPDFNQVFGSFNTPGWNPSEQTQGVPEAEWGANPLAEPGWLAAQQTAGVKGPTEFAPTFNEMWGQTPYNTLPNDQLSRSAQETLQHDFSFYPNPGYVQGPQQESLYDAAGRALSPYIAQPIASLFELLSGTTPLSGVTNPVTTLSNAISNTMLGSPNAPALSQQAIANQELGRQANQDLSSPNYIMDTPFVSPTMPTQTVNVDYVTAPPSQQQQPSEAPPAAPPAEAPPAAPPAEAPPAPPAEAPPAAPPQEAQPAQPPQEAQPAPPPPEAPNVAPPPNQVVTDITTPQSLLELGGVPPAGPPAPPAARTPTPGNPQPDNPQQEAPTTNPERTFTNRAADNPRNPYYQDAGERFGQGRPGRNWQTAEQAGIVPLFPTVHGVEHLNARLIAALNQAWRDMSPLERASWRTNSAFRPGTRGDGRALGGYNELETQESVWTRSNGGRSFPAARPGHSNHGGGRAVDINPGPALNFLQRNAARYGLQGIMGGLNGRDPVHIEMRGPNGGLDPRAERERQANEPPRPPADIPNVPPMVPPAMPRARPRDEGAPEDVPALPPAANPLPPPDRPPADIPTTPPARGNLDRGVLQNALNRIQAGMGPNAGQAEFTNALSQAVQEFARAGVPANVAREIFTNFAIQGATARGYGPNSNFWGMAQSYINNAVNSAMQGYRPAPAAPVQGPPSPGQQSTEAPGLLDTLGRFASFFNPISTAEARMSRDDKAALELARTGTSTGGQPGHSVVGHNIFTFYAPGASGPRGIEGPMIGSQNNVLVTLDDVRNGTSNVVSLAGHPSQFGKEVFIGNITYQSPIDGKTYTLENVVGRVDDTGGKFRNETDNPDLNKFDIAVGDFSRGWNDTTANAFTSRNTAQYVPSEAPSSMLAAEPPAVEPRAEGGPVKRGKPYLVGEEGPEYFVPDEPGTVVPYMPRGDRSGKEIYGKWPRVLVPMPGYDRMGSIGLGGVINNATRAAQDPASSLIDLMDTSALRINPRNWNRMLADPRYQAMGRARIEDRRNDPYF